MRSTPISQATRKDVLPLATYRNSLDMGWNLPCGLNECDLIDFLQCGDPRPDFFQRRLTQELHAFLARGLADSELGFFSRIISRMRSVRSSSSWMAVRPL